MPVIEESRSAFSDQLERWFAVPGPRTLGELVEMFGEKSFAVVFIALMAPSALPIPTGGVTNAFEIVVMLVSLELIAGRRTLWLPDRWKRLELSGESRQRLLTRLVRLIRWVERYSRMRLAVVLNTRVARAVFGALVLVLTLAAFLAPPFSGLDTLPSLGVVALSLGILLEDFLLALVGVIVGAAGVIVTLLLGSAVLDLVL